MYLERQDLFVFNPLSESIDIINPGSMDKNILQKLVNTIFNNGGVIESIKNESPTLENVFLNLTGKRLKN